MTPTSWNANATMEYDPREANFPISDRFSSDFNTISDSTLKDNLQEEDDDLSNAMLSYMNQILMEENVEDAVYTLEDSLKLNVTPTSQDTNFPIPGTVMSHFHTSSDLEQEDGGTSNAILGYMNQILMQEDAEDASHMIHDSLKLQEAEKSFYEVIGKKYPPSPQRQRSLANPGQYLGDPNPNGRVCDNNSDPSECSTTSFEAVEFGPDFQTSQSTLNSQNNISRTREDVDDGSLSVSLFIKGVEEASKLIPDIDELIFSAQAKGLEEGERHRKQANTNPDRVTLSDTFDEVLLNLDRDQNEAVATLRETLKNESVRETKKKAVGREVVDMRSYLIDCAQTIAADDYRTAHVLLNKIRLYSSPLGDGNQRLAHCFANGLEARLAGTGSQIYRALNCKRTSAAGMLKAHLLYLAACPFRRVSNFFANKTIGMLTRGAATIHIIDFGILYGFQWPTLIQRLSKRQGVLPKIRITGIEFPQPGFRPAERVEETGQRLAHYAKEFNIPFEFNPIVKRWETICYEDLKLGEDEVVVVNCIFRLKNLPDESMVFDCSRDDVLKMIRKINPVVFIQGVVNGGYNAPLFLSRFKEAIFHFSSHFDMLETIVPQESEERLLLERELIGREVFNVVACEGWDRVERPETYKKWHARTSRAGFVQLPLDQMIKDKSNLKVGAYCKEFVIDEDGQWLLLGWKGKISYALSTWKPA